MKKCFFTIFAYLLVVSLAACGQNRQDGSPNGGNGAATGYRFADAESFSDSDHRSVNMEDSAASDYGFANASGQEKDRKDPSAGSESKSGLKMLCGQSPFHNNHFGTDHGFYYFTQYDRIGNHLAGYHLMYIDYATKKEVYLCSDSSCGHNTESCSAVFSSREFGIDCLIFAGSNYLYVLNRDYDRDGTASFMMDSGVSPSQVEGEAVELYRMGFDGSGRQKIFSFPQNTTLENIVFGDGEDFWFVTKKLSFDVESNVGYTTSTNRSLVKYDVSENKITDMISLNFQDNLYHKVAGADGSCLILSAIEYPDGMTRDEAERLGEEEWKKLFRNSNTIYETLDIHSHEKREIYRSSNNSGLTPAHAVIDGTILFSDHENGGILKVTLSSGEKSRLSDTAHNEFVYVLKDAVCSFGEGNDESLYFTSVKTGETSRSTLTNQSTGWKIEIVSDTADQVLVIYDYIGKANGDGSFSIEGRCFALIDKTDLYAGRADYQPIKMAGSGM